MERIPIEDESLVCPYEECHNIMRSVMSLHLMRCRRNHLNSNLVECPFNNTHMIPEPELDWHVQECPNRTSFEHFNSRNKPLPATPRVELVNTNTDWDDLPPVPTYNPLHNIELRNIIRQPVGMTPSQRAAFRQAERTRLRNLRVNRN